MLVTELEKEKSAIEADKQKSTLTVDENDILKMAKKIEQNKNEDNNFAKALDLFVNDENKNNEPIVIGNTPNSLSIAGASQDKQLIIAPRTILKCISSPKEHYHGHDLSVDLIKKLPNELRNPVMIFKGSAENSLVCITQLKDNEDKGIIVALAINATEKRCEVNKITSAYGKNNLRNYINAQLDDGNLIAYNTEKTNKMFQSLGLQLPPEETFISFDNSIAYTKRNVKGFDKENKRNLIPAKNIEKHTYTAKKPSVLDKLQNLKEQSKSDRPPALAKALHDIMGLRLIAIIWRTALSMRTISQA